MANSNTVQHPAIEKLYDDIVQQEETVATLRAQGHVYADAERHLNRMKDRLSHFDTGEGSR